MQEIVGFELSVRIGQIVIESYIVAVDISVDIQCIIILFIVLFLSFLHLESVLRIDIEIISEILLVYRCRIEIVR